MEMFIAGWASFEEQSVACILCAGTSRLLLDTRKLLLERAGHHVVTVTNERSLQGAFDIYDFDLVVIGQTLSAKVKRVIASLVRERSTSTKILELYAPHFGPAIDDADSWLQVPVDVASEFVNRVNAMVRKPEALAS